MRQTYRILPVCTSDVSGVCSALYELGGMVVIHDPSGCNSTYNTHDEIRWYEKDSLIFISGLTQKDAILGNDEKFCRDILETAENMHPAFIALTNSPVPYLTGTDFPALARSIERESSIPVFYVSANGMHDYTAGAGKAFGCVARRLVYPAEHKVPGSVNLLGMTPLDFPVPGTAGRIRKVFDEAGFTVLSIWAMADRDDEEGDMLLRRIRRAGEAKLNIVLSSVGLLAAKVLWERFGTPYIVGTPAGLFTGELIKQATFIMDHPSDFAPETSAAYAHVPDQGKDERCVTLVAEPVSAGSLAAAIRMETGLKTRVLCPLETCEHLLRTQDRALHGEEAIEAALSDASRVVADPFYRLICPKETAFYPLPSLALSGRSFLKEAVDLTQLSSVL